MGEVDAVAASQERWRDDRRTLNSSRADLARLAAGLYGADVRVGGLPFMALPGWLPDAPIPLDDVRLEWTDELVPVGVTGGEPEAAAALPLLALGSRFARYTSAIEDLDRPALFENRPSYRLLDVDLSADPHMRFGIGSYFAKLDLAEAVAHELAAARPTGKARWDALPLRALVADPFDLRDRYVLPAIETLTLRRNRATGDATFLLLWRDPAKVATSAGVYGLVPAGEFQPSTAAAHDRENDFSLWRSMVREYSEEILGEPERDGSCGEPLDYEEWPLYRALHQARRDGRVRPYCLGIGLDTLTLTATVLTVTVVDDDVFDDLFRDAVEINAEGTMVRASEEAAVSHGVPFDDENVSRLLDQGPIGSPGACILDRAWAFRLDLLPRG